MSDADNEVMRPSDEWPNGYEMIASVVASMGTDWVRACCDQIEAGDDDEQQDDDDPPLTDPAEAHKSKEPVA